MSKEFETKDDARQYVWQKLSDEGVARFPFPPEGRIPNFAGAEEAARRLLDHELFENVKTMKCNPDSPQHPLRKMCLERGVVVYVPTPRLRGGFMKLDPEEMPVLKQLRR